MLLLGLAACTAEPLPTLGEDTIRAVVVDGFKIAMGKDPKVKDEVAAIFHGTHFVLVDERMRIRAYHENDKTSAVPGAVRDARRLVSRP